MMKKFFKAFPYALAGIEEAIKKERNLKFHLMMAVLVIVLGIILGISVGEWLVLILVIFAILAAETFNSALEGICDLLKEENNLDYARTRFIRDASAGAVFFLVVASVIIGLIIFLPRLLALSDYITRQ